MRHLQARLTRCRAATMYELRGYVPEALVQPPPGLSLEELEVRRWRREVLMRAGYDKEAADALAGRPDIDLMRLARERAGGRLREAPAGERAP